MLSRTSKIEKIRTIASKNDATEAEQEDLVKLCVGLRNNKKDGIEATRKLADCRRTSAHANIQDHNQAFDLYDSIQDRDPESKMRVAYYYGNANIAINHNSIERSIRLFLEVIQMPELVDELRQEGFTQLYEVINLQPDTE